MKKKENLLPQNFSDSTLYENGFEMAMYCIVLLYKEYTREIKSKTVHFLLNSVVLFSKTLFTRALLHETKYRPQTD